MDTALPAFLLLVNSVAGAMNARQLIINTKLQAPVQCIALNGLGIFASGIGTGALLPLLFA